MPSLTPRRDSGALRHRPPLVPAQRASLPPAPCTADAWALVIPHQARLLALARACGATPDTARDVVQEALLRTATRTGLDVDRLAGHLTVVVRRLVIDQHRADHRQQQLTRHRALEPACQPGPEEQACQHAEASWLAQQTRRLRPRERQALTLHSAGATNRQIATDLDTTSSAVEHLLHRARTTLKLLLAGTLALTAGTCTLTCASATHSRPHPAAAATRRALLAPALPH